jgi:hypothetical protein
VCIQRTKRARIAAALAARTEDCAGLQPAHARFCPGWVTDTTGHVERCDDCAWAVGLGAVDAFDDDDARQLARQKGA